MTRNSFQFLVFSFQKEANRLLLKTENHELKTTN